MGMTHKPAMATLFAMTCLGIVGCGSQGARSAWNDVVKKCANTDLTGDRILYFGPSNNVGPASIWREVEGGGFRLRWTTAEMPGVERAALLKGIEASCAGTRTINFSGEATAGLVTSIAPVSGDLSADFSRARTVSVSTTSIAWDTLKEGPFELYVHDLDDSNPIKLELKTNSRLVEIRALRVRGFTAELKFNGSDAASLKAKYQGGLPAGVTGDLNAGVQAKWTEATTLKISAPDFYIAGELGHFKSDSFSAVEVGGFEPVKVDSAARIEREVK
jgi:hypothetical protein